MKEVILIMLTVFLIACSKDPTPDDNPPKVGDNFQGGTVFYISPDNSFCLIGAENDLPAAPWTDKAYAVIGCNNNSLGGGMENTQKIITALGTGTYAARECYDFVLEGYDDWYLPNEEELNALNTAFQNGLSNTYDYWWTSFEWPSNTSLYAEKGPTRMNVSYAQKNTILRVRPVRQAIL